MGERVKFRYDWGFDRFRTEQELSMKGPISNLG